MYKRQAQEDSPDLEMPEASESDSQASDPIEPDPPPGFRSYSGGWGWKKDTWWTSEYKAARAFLYGTKTSKPDFEQALVGLKEEALRGNGFAMHDLGKMVLAGLGCEKDEEQAQEWFRKAFSAFCAREPDVYKRQLQEDVGKLTLDSLAVAFGEHQPIDDLTFSILCDAMEHDERITALLEFDFDSGIISVKEQADP